MTQPAQERLPPEYFYGPGDLTVEGDVVEPFQVGTQNVICQNTVIRVGESLQNHSYLTGVQ